MSKQKTVDSAVRTGTLKRTLVTVYAILAIAATGRSCYQIIRKFDEAPLAYTLSAVAAAIYILATVALIRGRGGWLRVAWVALILEMVGVLTVGTLSLTVPDLFAHAAVWSYFGAGYVFIPLVLPVLGMLWLRRVGAQEGRSSGVCQESNRATARAVTEGGEN